MKLKSKIAAGIAIALIFSGCAGSDSDTQTSDSNIGISADILYTISTKVLSFEGKNDNGAVIYNASVTYPVISSSDNNEVVNSMNEKFKSAAESFIKDEEIGEDFITAKEDNLLTENSSYEFPGYYKAKTYSTQYNKNGIISFLRSIDMYMGGAHPGHNLWGETYDMATGNEMKITDVLKMSQEEVNNIIVEGFRKEAEKDQERYSGTSPEEVAKNVNEAKWYLTDDGIVFFFNEYEILPYAAGTPEYVFPYAGNEDKFNFEL